MKNLIFILFSLISLVPLLSQEFSFQMYFRDAIGNRDTITLGYDLLGTDSTDIAFEEKNIISFPINEKLDVRFSNEFRNRNYFKKPGTFHTKKQIAFYDCKNPVNYYLQTLDIHTKNWPVTASWNKTPFFDLCRNGSVFTSINPGGWWDTGSPSNLYRQILASTDSVTFNSNANGNFVSGYSYKNDNMVVPVFWIAIGNDFILSTPVLEVSHEYDLKIFPNPASSRISIQVAQSFGNVENVQFYSSIGSLVLSSKSKGIIEISHMENGLYTIMITNENGLKIWKRVLIKND